MKVLICWSHISGYMAACWRALAVQPGIELSVIAFRTDTPGAGTEAGFKDDVVADLSIRLLNPDERENAALIESLVCDLKPNDVVVPGWFHAPYKALVTSPKLANAKFIMTMDTPIKLNWRQKLARFQIGSYLDKMSGVVVAGERAFQFARLLKIPEAKILRGVYGFDAKPLINLRADRLALPTGWPRKFLYTGRYVEDKAIDVMLAAYAKYRAASKNPWPLTCCGKGPLGELIKVAEGVTDRGFVQPKDLPRILTEHGAMVLASRYEPWGVVVAEAQASGLPVICSEAVGASVELVRHLHNGLIVPTENVDRLAAAMRWVESNYDALPAMGQAAETFAAAFTADRWASRWSELIGRI